MLDAGVESVTATFEHARVSVGERVAHGPGPARLGSAHATTADDHHEHSTQHVRDE
jgi:hypothetical protein